jgi:uncharacterized protein (TIGR03067 family)
MNVGNDGAARSDYQRSHLYLLMKTLFILCAALAASWTTFASDKAPDSRAIQGVWKPVEADMGGAPLPGAALKSITLRIEGDKYEVTVTGEPKSDKGTTVCDESTAPKRLNITGTDGPNKGKTIPAIYEIKDDATLRVCYDLSGAKHPAEFKSTPGSQLFNVTYKRQPAPEDPAAAIAAIKKLGGDVRHGGNGAVQSVGLDKAKITDADLVHLKPLTTLQTLSLRFTELTGTGLGHLKELPALTSLYLPGSTVSDAGLAEIGKMRALVNLYVQHSKITDDGLAHLKNLATLRILYIDNNKITDAGLAHLKGLTEMRGLYFSNTAVTDAGLENLKGMTHLHYLDVRKTGVTEAGIKKLKASLPECDIKQ